MDRIVDEGKAKQDTALEHYYKKLAEFEALRMATEGERSESSNKQHQVKQYRIGKSFIDMFFKKGIR